MRAAAPGAERNDAPTLTILFVDHSRVSQAVWNRVILRLGHRALMTNSAEDALNCLAETRVDVVCTALSLPGLDGIDFCRRLRENHNHAGLPVILLTTRNDPDTRERCRAAGITDVQAKSDVERLLRRLRIYADQADASIRGRVLYVEDSDVAAHVVSGALRKLNLAVDHFNRADAALAAFNVHDYDLVVTDIQSDGFGGIGLIKHIRGLAGRRGRAPIVATSGDDTREHKSALFRLGIDDFLPKPALEEEIVARIGNLVRGKLLNDQVRSQQARLRELSLIDPLTGLLNAASLHELGPKYLSEAARHGYPLSLILISVRDAGDAAIAAVGQLLHNACRGEDLVTRCDNHAFAILLAHCNLSQARVRATRLRQDIAALKPLSLDPHVGVSGFAGEEGLALGDLLAAAQFQMNAPLPHAQYEGDAERDQ
ncbi:MAG TPA: response regulator [Gammaproteobacteria bacterium]|nr:response regulator [Gammaproteobacteria bacterium]